MGMYNEVFYPCPKCQHYGYMQISQIVNGFGNFYLDNPQTLMELNKDQLNLLKEYIKEDWFNCQNKDCNHQFNPYREDLDNDKLNLIKEIFNK